MAKEELRNTDGLTEREFLDQYDVSLYKRPSVSVDTLLYRSRRSTAELSEASAKGTEGIDGQARESPVH